METLVESATVSNEIGLAVVIALSSVPVSRPIVASLRSVLFEYLFTVIFQLRFKTLYGSLGMISPPPEI